MATFDYTSRDFLSIRQDLINRARNIIPEWSDTDTSDFANMFIDLWAYMGDILHFYIDRAASETFLDTATQRDSVLAIANLLDYIPAGARASRGTVTFKLNTGSNYTIPQYTTLTGYDDDKNPHYFYTASESSVIVAVNDQVTIPVIQGEIIANEFVGTSNGSANQRFTLIKNNIDVDSITVQVFEGPLDTNNDPTAVSYTYVAQLSTTTYLDKVFTARVQSDGYTQILFGNSFNGMVPSTNATIIATYRTTDGAEGNLGTNKVSVVNGSPSTAVSIVSSTAMSGGANKESLESIRTNVARLYRTQDRAVSLQDYKDLALQTPGVSKSTATVTGSAVTLYPVPHQTNYPPAPTSGQVIIPVTNSMAESIQNYFVDRSMVGVTASVVTGGAIGGYTHYVYCTPVYIRLEVHVLDNYVRSWVQNEVDVAIRELLSFENVSFEQLLTVGEVYRAALSATGVDYVTILNLDDAYSALNTVATVANVQTDSTKLLCFSDAVNPAVTFNMLGGLTGSN
jgi:hypothetical protein